MPKTSVLAQTFESEAGVSWLIVGRTGCGNLTAPGQQAGEMPKNIYTKWPDCVHIRKPAAHGVLIRAVSALVAGGHESAAL